MKLKKEAEENMASETPRSKRRSSRSGESSKDQKPSLKMDEQKESKQKTPTKRVTAAMMKQDEIKVKSKQDEVKKKQVLKKDEEKKECIARKVINYEEELSLTRDSLEDVQEYQATCQNIKNIVTQINELKKLGNENQQDELHAKRLEAMLLTTNLKKLNRLAQIRGHKAKESTQEVKKKVDLMHLDLQNLLYEVMHMKKEINKCMNFSSKDEEIDLIGVEQFYDEASEDVSKPEITKEDSHQQMLARLDYELKKRKELAIQKKERMEEKKKTESELHQKTDYLSNLKPRLDSIIKATLPVQEFMGLPIEAERMLFEKAQYLPKPLYVLYIQAKAFKDVCDTEMDVDIEGDLHAAKALFDERNVESGLSGDESETEKDTEKENGGESDTRGRKARKDGKTARLGVHQERLLKRHPFAVHITLKKTGEYSISMKFYHLPALHFSTVEVNLTTEEKTAESSSILSPNILLNDLLCKDAGQQSPNSANKYQLEKLEMKELSCYISTIGLPYYWVQWICGLNYLPNEEIFSYTSSSALSVKHFQAVMKKIRSRINARLALHQQLNQLEQLVVPVSKKRKISTPQPKKVSMLAEWRAIYYEDVLKYKSAEQLTDCGLITEDCMFYEAKLAREEALHVAVVIHTNYPTQPPLLLLSYENGSSAFNTDPDVLCLEGEMNAFVDELLLHCDRKMLLSCMIEKLQICFDIFVETQPQKQTKEKLYTRKARGRDRNRPYVYHDDGYFVHR